MPNLFFIDEGGWVGGVDAKFIDVDIQASTSEFNRYWSITVSMKGNRNNTLSEEPLGEKIASLLSRLVERYDSFENDSNYIKNNSVWLEPQTTQSMHISELVKKEYIFNDFSIRLVFSHENPPLNDADLQTFFDTIKSDVKDEASILSFSAKTHEEWEEEYKDHNYRMS